MAFNTQRLYPLRQAKARRRELPRYLNLDGGRYLLTSVILLCLMSLIVLAQTGVVATKGYAITALEQERTDLLRERTQLQLRQAAAQSLDQVRTRAEQIGLRPFDKDQVRYITVEPSIIAPTKQEPGIIDQNPITENDGIARPVSDPAP
jgi:hypothetical protein